MKLTICILIINLMLAFCSCASDISDRHLPKWVPAGAIDSAEVYLKCWAPEFSKYAYDTYSNIDYREVDQKEYYLRYAWEEMCVDYPKYEEGDKIQDYFYCHDTTGIYLMNIGFGVFCKEMQLGTINVMLMQDSTWHWSNTGFRAERYEDYLPTIFQRYPNSGGYKLFKHCMKFFYLPEKDGVISEIMACGYEENGKFVYTIHIPEPFLMENKNRYMEYLEWEHMMKEQELNKL